jgi:hypothetical protein
MSTASGDWVLTATGEGYEKFTTQDNVMYRQYVGAGDLEIAKIAKFLRDENGGKFKEGQVAFHMPQTLADHLTATVPELKHGDSQQQKAWWRKWQDTPTGRIWKVQGV